MKHSYKEKRQIIIDRRNGRCLEQIVGREWLVSNIENDEFSYPKALIRGLIGYAPSLRPINDMMIEPTLYCKYLESQETTHISEENQDCPGSNEKQEERVEG